ncbi:MAG: tetratricopeptide repeat protein [Candidatus Aminicenantes bacterium]|nr:tetratricopeptide repeat protein [Candidatus Aminicenantes bacterium]
MGVEGKGEESIFTMVDELTRRIKENFNFSQEQIANDIDTEVGKITTSAPESYKYYSEGRKVSIKGDYRQAIPFLEKAVEIDPEFAMAYRALAEAYNNIGEREESTKR